MQRTRRQSGEEIEGFEWDEAKRLKVLEERGIDFVDVARMLLGRVLEYQSPRNDEQRFVAVGPGEDDILIAAVYVVRGKRLRIVTARRARKDEQRAYLHAVADPADEGKV